MEPSLAKANRDETTVSMLSLVGMEVERRSDLVLQLIDTGKP